MKIKKNLTIISLMLGVMMLISVTGMVSAGVSDPCNERYRIDTYQSNYLTLKDTFNQGETVYAKGWDGEWNLRILFKFPNGTIAKTCAGNAGPDTSCNFVLPLNAPTGTWKVELQYNSGGWTFWDCEPFTVVIPPTPSCGDQVCNGAETCSTCPGDCGVCPTPTCTLTVTKPTLGQWFDKEPVPVEWTLSQGCTPLDYFYISYKKDGDCNDLDHDWLNLTWGANGEFGTGNPYAYLWDRPQTSGQYCVKVKVTSNGARDSSEVFNVDLIPPEVDLSVGDNHVGNCLEETEGNCYVNQQTSLTLTCADNNPVASWQSGVDKIEYRYSVDGGEFTSWKIYEGAFSFPEDTNHVLEYRCFDKVGKVDTESKAFIVDSLGPEFVEKTIGEPKYCVGELCETYVTQDTKICVSYEDPMPHPVNDVKIYCSATVRNTLQGEPYEVKISLDEDGCFKFGEDSYHSLNCWAEDALGNHNVNEDLVEQDIVDTVAPATTLGFEGPYYTNQVSQWIDTISNVTLTAEDPQPHPVGLAKTFYRYEQVDDSWCYGTHEGGWQATPTDDESWVEYNNEPFGLPESCHVVEYYSVDLLGNTEAVQHKFVFSDHTAPLTTKVVGKPSSKCGLLNNCGDSIWNWYENPEQKIEYEVTLNTEITINCEDQGNHPSGVGNAQGSGIWYRIVLDGKYNDTSANWKFEQTGSAVIQFPEQSEHLLEFYCVDNVGKTSETDSELFKVTGTAFTLQIGDKWDLISVPFQLIGDGDVEDVFNDSNIVEVWSYENGEWKVYSPSDGLFGLDTIVPGRGYWVKTTDGTTLTIGGSLMKPASLPPSVELDKGWNLIGHYDLSSRKAYCSLFSLVDTQQGFPRWSALWGYNSASQIFTPLTQWDYTNPGRGYWLEMDVEDSYGPSSICYGFS